MDTETQETLQTQEAEPQSEHLQGNHDLWAPRLAAQSLLRNDARLEFGNRLFDIHRFWLQLVYNTTLPTNISCTDPAVLAAFRAIDQVIEGSAYRLARLAYFRLTRLMANLISIISVNRKHGTIHRSIGYRNASVALDIYTLAQTNKDETRQRLSRRIRSAKRWFHLGGPSPLLLIVHTDAAEHLVGSSTVTNDNLRSLGNEVLQVYPAELVQASTYLTNTVELAVKSGSEYNVQDSYTHLMDLQRRLL